MTLLWNVTQVVGVFVIVVLLVVLAIAPLFVEKSHGRHSRNSQSRKIKASGADSVHERERESNFPYDTPL
jgi:NADH:ubiquinone oxidoreductase subunit 3 (subunit A)